MTKFGRRPATGEGKFGVASKAERTLEEGGQLIVFDSKLEKRHYLELRKHYSAAAIRRQVRFLLQPAFRCAWNGKAERPLVYVADFVLGDLRFDDDGFGIPGVGAMILDAKGMILPQFRLAVRLFEYKYGMPVWPVKTLTALRGKIQDFEKMKQVSPNLLNVLTSPAFQVTGYRSSDGSVSDLVFRKLKLGDYHDLVRQSLDKLQAAAREVVESGVEELAVCAAVEKLQTQFRKTLTAATVSDSAPPKETAEPLAADILMVDGDPEKLAVFRLLQTSANEIKPPDKPKKQTVEEQLRKRLPVYGYTHRINLYPGKYAEVRAV